MENKTKSNKGLIGIIVILIIIVIALTTIVVMDKLNNNDKTNNVTNNNTVNKDDKTKNEVTAVDIKMEKYTLKYTFVTRKEEDVYNYSRIKKNEKIEFYKDNTKVYEYVCKSNYCSFPNVEDDSFNEKRTMYGPIIRVIEHEKDDDVCIDCYGHDIIENKNGLDLKLYNIETKKLIKTIRIKDEYYSWGLDDVPLFLVKNMSDKYVLLDLNGKEYKKFNKLGERSGYENTFIDLEVDSNYKYIIYSKNGKYGLETIIGNKVIFDFKYDDIVFYTNDDYIILKENGLSYLYDLKNNKMVNNIGYDNIVAADFEKSDYLLVYKDKMVSLIDINGNKITDILKTDLYDFPPKFSGGIRSYFYNDIFHISFVTKDPNDFDNNGDRFRSFEYNITNKTLKEVKSDW